MPIYEFECLACRAQFEKLCGINSGNDGIKCPNCEASDIRRLISSFYSRSGGGSESGSTPSSCGGCRRSSCAGCR